MRISNYEVKMIIFDLDGTLLDSCKIWHEVDVNFFKKRNLPMPEDYSQAISHMGLEKASQYTKSKFNLDETPEDILKEWEEAVVKKYEEEVLLKDYAKEFLELVKLKKLILAVATAGQENCYKPCLKRNEIWDYFSQIIDVKNYENGKNDPQIYLDIAKNNRVKPEEILVIEDIVTALNSAKEGGFKTCAIYESTSLEEDTKKRISDIYITSFLDLIKLCE